MVARSPFQRKCPDYSRGEGDLVLTCPSPGQLDQEAVCQVSLGVGGHLGVAALPGPEEKVSDGGQVGDEGSGQSQVRLRRGGWRDTVGGLQGETGVHNESIQHQQRQVSERGPFGQNIILNQDLTSPEPAESIHMLSYANAAISLVEYVWID